MLGFLALVGGTLVAGSAVVHVLGRRRWAASAERAGLVAEGSGKGVAIVLAGVQVVLAVVLIWFGVSQMRGSALPENLAFGRLAAAVPDWLLLVLSLIAVAIVVVGGLLARRAFRQRSDQQGPFERSASTPTEIVLPVAAMAVGVAALLVVLLMFAIS
jgi:heme exporter protein D